MVVKIFSSKFRRRKTVTSSFILKDNACSVPGHIQTGKFRSEKEKNKIT